MKLLITLMLSFLILCGYAQEIVFSRDVKSDTLRPTKGPNLKYFTHPYIGLGFPFYTDEDVTYTKTGSSMIVDYGIRFKRRFNNTFAVGLDLSMNWAAYKIKQDEGKSFPDSAINKKEKFQVNSLTPAVYARINVGKRGNFVGNFMDLGAYGSWNWKKAHKTTNENNAGERVKVLTTGLTYMESLSYGLLARIGDNRFVLTARYRLSDLFKSSSDIPEVPRFSAGLEMGLFK